MHRIDKRQSKARPVILRLYDFKEKQDIMRNCYRLKGLHVSISDDFSKRVLHSGKCLWESAKDENLSGKRVRLAYDKLYVGGKAYYWDDSTDSRKECRNARHYAKDTSLDGS